MIIQSKKPYTKQNIVMTKQNTLCKVKSPRVEQNPLT